MNLFIGTHYKAKVGTSSGVGNVSYYTFTTDEVGGYTVISALNPNNQSRLHTILYDNESTFIKSIVGNDSGAFMGVTLDANTTYQLSIENYTDTNDTMYDLWIYSAPFI